MSTKALLYKYGPKYEALSIHIAGQYPELLAVVNYFENSYLAGDL